MKIVVCPSCNHSFVPHTTLSAREQQIVELAALGDGNKLIGRKLGISDGTVKMHMHSILTKLGLRSRHELSYWLEKQL